MINLVSYTLNNYKLLRPEPLRLIFVLIYNLRFLFAGVDISSFSLRHAIRVFEN